MTKYPVVVVDSMDGYIAFATKEDAEWYHKSWPNVSMETAFSQSGMEYNRIMREGLQVGIRYFYN